VHPVTRTGEHAAPRSWHARPANPSRWREGESGDREPRLAPRLDELVARLPAAQNRPGWLAPALDPDAGPPVRPRGCGLAAPPGSLRAAALSPRPHRAPAAVQAGCGSMRRLGAPSLRERRPPLLACALVQSCQCLCRRIGPLRACSSGSRSRNRSDRGQRVASAAGRRERVREGCGAHRDTRAGPAAHACGRQQAAARSGWQCPAAHGAGCCVGPRIVLRRLCSRICPGALSLLPACCVLPLLDRTLHSLPGAHT